jgi:single-strand DNA-binding protein
MKNLAQIEGNLGQTPTYTKLSSGKEVTRFTVAVNKTWKKGNEKKKVTDWFRVEAWGHLAIPASRLHKGDAVFVQGETRTGSYVDKEGTNHNTTTIVAINLRKLDYSIFAKDDAPEPTVPETEEADGENNPF